MTLIALLELLDDHDVVEIIGSLLKVRRWVILKFDSLPHWHLPARKLYLDLPTQRVYLQ